MELIWFFQIDFKSYGFRFSRFIFMFDFWVSISEFIFMFVWMFIIIFIRVFVQIRVLDLEKKKMIGFHVSGLNVHLQIWVWMFECLFIVIIAKFGFECLFMFIIIFIFWVSPSSSKLGFVFMKEKKMTGMKLSHMASTSVILKIGDRLRVGQLK